MANKAYRDSTCQDCGESIEQGENIYFGTDRDVLCRRCAEIEEIVCPECGGQKKKRFPECWECGRDKHEGVKAVATAAPAVVAAAAKTKTKTKEGRRPVKIKISGRKT